MALDEPTAAVVTSHPTLGQRAVLLAVMLVLGACTVEPGTLPPHEEPAAIPAGQAPTPGFGLLSDHGVSFDPCPATTNPDNGCIRLGVLVDSSGPFAALGQAATAGAQAFWHHVNEQGGVVAKPRDGIEARFDVDVTTHVADNAYDVERHMEEYRQLEPDVLALSLSMGTPMTAEALPAQARAELVAVPIGWWSGWAFEPLVAESGASYCIQAMNGMDWARDELGDTSLRHVVVVHAPGRYGQDVLAAVEHWTDPDGPGGDHPRLPFEASEHAVVVEPGADVTSAVQLIADVAPEVVVLATDPEQLRSIASRTAERGWDGLLVGTAPTFEPSLLEDDDAAEVLASRFVRIGNVGPLSQGGKAYADMREALGLDEDGDIDASATHLPANDAWIAGWVSQYPLHLALEDAIAAGDLSRAGVLEATRSLTVDYDRALPETSYDDAPNDALTRRTFVYRPDRDAPMGQRLVDDAYVGPTVAQLHVSRPCTDR